MSEMPDVLFSNGVGIGPEASGYHTKYLSASHVDKTYVPREQLEEALYFLKEARGQLKLLHQDNPSWLGLGMARQRLDIALSQIEGKHD
tara:strand:+ start:5776 stop:6042 length:267 start_codon:yes stop_codon:yes gene_type:complete